MLSQLKKLKTLLPYRIVWGLLAGAIALLLVLLSSQSQIAQSQAERPSIQTSHPQVMFPDSALAPLRFSQINYLNSRFDGYAHELFSDAFLASDASSISNVSTYTPREDVAPAHPTNYGYRYLTDIHGNPVTNSLIVVIHETVGSADSAIRLFQTSHPNDSDQVSYHSLIRRDGTIVHLVHPQLRAYGAGNSVFEGSHGPEAVQTNPNFPPSVNNFAYHTSLETPADGRGNQNQHSGYTDAQYQSLAWLIARLPVPDERITTHRAVDRSGRKRDPRSFASQRFYDLLHTYPRAQIGQADRPAATS
jgi:N-acetyl-anhydromuramyl-L-alanine amidase AmpD